MHGGRGEGDGPLRSRLEQLRDDLDLTEKIELPGEVKNPWAQLVNESEIFVLNSSYEGFPMVLCEAMSEGMAVISTMYHSGVVDIVDEGVNGLLVEVDDTDQLVDRMRHLITKPQQRKKIGIKAREIAKKYGLKTILASWSQLIESSAVAVEYRQKM